MQGLAAVAKIMEMSKVKDHQRRLPNGMTVMVKGYTRSLQRNIRQMEKMLAQLRKMPWESDAEREQIARAIGELVAAIARAKVQNDRAEKVLNKS